jgi:drug/metabolite transporter (DMT)-like permease
MQKDKLKSTLHFHFIVFIFGFTAILGKLISIDALSLVWYRMSMASIVLGVVLWTKKASFRMTNKQLAVMSLCGLLIALHWICFFHAIKISNVSITLAILASGAFVTALVEPFFYKRKFILYEIVLGFIVVIGLAVILDAEYTYVNGIIYAGLAMIFSVAFTLINGVFVHQSDARVMSFYQLGTGAIFTTLFLSVSHGFDVDFFSIKTSDILWLVLLATICTAYAFVVSISVMRHLSPFSVMLGINMEPVYGILLAMLIFGDSERMDISFYLGTILILISVMINGVLKLKNPSKDKK